MDTIYKYLEALRQKEYIKQNIRDIRKNLYKQYVALYKTRFMILDIAMICVILFNFGAVILTNIMVVKQTPDIEFMETNPIQSELLGYVQHEDGINLFVGFLIHILVIILAIVTYIYLRSTIFTDAGYYFLIIFVTYLFIGLGLDFISDLGYFIGKKIFG